MVVKPLWSSTAIRMCGGGKRGGGDSNGRDMAEVTEGAAAALDTMAEVTVVGDAVRQNRKQYQMWR